jgi:hypothetical protein
MNSETRTILGRAIEVLFRELNQGNADNPKYRLQHDPERRDLAFSIAEKAPPGVRFADGQNWKRWIGPSWRQCEQIAISSNSLEEIVHRWKKLVFEGIDTTRTMSQDGKPVGVSEVEFNQKVDERVQAILKEHLSKLMVTRNDQEIRAVAHAPTETPLQGIQKKPPRSNANGKNRINLWTERAKILGIDGPTITSVTHQIHKSWLEAANRLWDAHVQAKPAAAPVTEVPATVGSA